MYTRKIYGKHTRTITHNTHNKCSLSKNKAGFYRSFSAIFGKIGGCASEEVVFALIKTKCLPVLLYGTEVCPTNAADLQSMQLAI